MTMDETSSNVVGNLAMCASLLLSSEFLRRCYRMCVEMCSTLNLGSGANNFAVRGQSFPSKLQKYFEELVTPWFDLKFVFTWLAVLTATLFTQEKYLSVALFPPFLAFVLAYTVIHDRLLLSPSFIEKELTDGTNHIGPGLAVAWFSFIENVLLDVHKKEEQMLKKYKEEQSIGSGRGISEAFKSGYFITDRPIILCPDLASYIERYEKSLEKESGKWCMALTNGIIKIDQMERKKEGEREWLFSVTKNMSYEYEVSGTKRDCEFRVVRWEDNRDNRFSPGITNKYFRVIDNRPLDSMRKWYHDQKDRGLTIGELKNQYELFVETLNTMLNKQESLKDKFYLLPFSGILSKKLITLEEYIQKCEKMPP